MKINQMSFYVLLSLMMILHSCSSSNDKKETETNPDEYSPYPEPEPDHHAGAEETVEPVVLPVVNRAKYHTIEIKQMKFYPDELVVEKGDTVVWVNNGITTHDVTEQPSRMWASSPIPVGKSWQMVVTSGADYYCSIHVVMKGKLLIR
jgi:plastocyanin